MATMKEVIEYEASQGRRLIEGAKEQGVTVDEFLDRSMAICFIRSLYTKEKMVKLFESSHNTCVNGSSHLAAERMQEKFLDIAFGDPKKLGIDEQVKSQPVTIVFDDSIKESDV